ncbi:hypothetical protein CspeluHIS016_0103970 [Cutaneotrichosporon spelunceum]|uniref:Uncharacterized protein n=1 Tax=Cutaneotrichosporon spelunceum TaxID=1672016 RepID=A0AAD3Y7X9_9TREE|nr:hypothetical protein CspeluHIS016_0103970 [Cutaneotrichosporon spelunceum]
MRPLTVSPLALDSHPYILNVLIRNSPHSALLALRTGSRPLRDAIDKFLVTHVAVYHSSRMVMARLPEGHRRIPRSNWLGVAELADAVRVVDIIVTQEDDQAAQAHNARWTEAVYRCHQYRMRDPSLIAPPRCWCNQDTVDVSAFNLHLSIRLRRVGLLRRWGGHRCRQLIKAQRSITFLVAETAIPAHEFLHGDAEASPCHIVHIGSTRLPVLQRHHLPQNVGHIILRVALAPNATRNQWEPAAHVRSAREDDPVTSLMRLLARLVSNNVSITLVGLERSLLFADDAIEGDEEGAVSIQSEVSDALFNCLAFIEGVPEKDAALWADRHVRLVTEEEYRT